MFQICILVPVSPVTVFSALMPVITNLVFAKKMSKFLRVRNSNGFGWVVLAEGLFTGGSRTDTAAGMLCVEGEEAGMARPLFMSLRASPYVFCTWTT